MLMGKQQQNTKKSRGKKKSRGNIQKEKRCELWGLKRAFNRWDAQRLEGADDEAGHGPTMAPCFSSCALSNTHTDVHLPSPLCDPQCAWGFYIHCESLQPGHPLSEGSQLPPHWAFLSNCACPFLPWEILAELVGACTLACKWQAVPVLSGRASNTL